MTVGLKLFISHFPRYHCPLLSELLLCIFCPFCSTPPFFSLLLERMDLSLSLFVCMSETEILQCQALIFFYWKPMTDHLLTSISFFSSFPIFCIFDYCNDWILCPIYLIYSQSLNYIFSGYSNWNSDRKLESDKKIIQ